MRLCDETGRAHAQEAEAPEHEIEEQAAERHAAEILRAVEMAGHGRIDRAENRLGQVGEDDRKGKREHAPMGCRGRLRPGRGR